MYSNAIRLGMADDQPLILEGLKALLQQSNKFQFFSFTKGDALVDFIQENKLDVVLLDIVLSDGNGLDFCKVIKKKLPRSIVIAIGNIYDRRIIFRFLDSGGSGYILKNAGSQEIIQCIDKALGGGLALCSGVRDIMLSPAEPNYGLPRMTKREQEILEEVSKGHTTNEIAKRFFISNLTVETHRRNLLKKYEAKNMTELVRIAVENKLL